MFAFRLKIFFLLLFINLNLGAEVFVDHTLRVSISTNESEGNGFVTSASPAMTPDSRYVVFGSSATNLVPNDINSQTDIFIRDTQLGSTLRVNVNSAGSQAQGGFSRESCVSPDGRFVAFYSEATNLVENDFNEAGDIFLRDLESNTTVRISVNSAGEEAKRNGFLQSTRPQISADGRYVVFESTATNLVAGDINEEQDIFLRDTQNGITTRISISSEGVPANGV